MLDLVNRKIGQVSLPVLSRKGKYDYWDYNWISIRNYSYNFNEDIFLKNFFFLFFMYNVSHTKTFLPIFFRSQFNTTAILSNKNIYNLNDFDLKQIYRYITTKPRNKYYVSKIYLTRYINWMFVYFFIYSITNIRIKSHNLYSKLIYKNHAIFYHAYLKARYSYHNR